LEHIQFWVFSGCRLQVTVGKLSLGEAQWIGTWSTILFYLTGRITSPLEPVVSTMIFIAKVIGLSTICKVMHVSTHIVFMTGHHLTSPRVSFKRKLIIYLFHFHLQLRAAKFSTCCAEHFTIAQGFVTQWISSCKGILSCSGRSGFVAQWICRAVDLSRIGCCRAVDLSQWICRAVDVVTHRMLSCIGCFSGFVVHRMLSCAEDVIAQWIFLRTGYRSRCANDWFSGQLQDHFLTNWRGILKIPERFLLRTNQIIKTSLIF
jgi:hypothetical protein